MFSEDQDKQICDIPTDGSCVDVDTLSKLNDCKLPVGSCIGLQTKIVDEHGHEIDGDWKKDKNGKWIERKKCEHKMISKSKINKDTQPDTNIELQTSVTVEIPKKDPVVPQKKEVDENTSMTFIISMICGIIGSSASTFVKNLFKSKNKQKEDEVTDCKTHQVKANMKFSSLSKRVTDIENKNKESGFDIDLEDLKNLKERIEKLEKNKK